MAPKYSAGDIVRYHPIGGPTTMVTSLGTIQRVLTQNTPNTGDSAITVKASMDHPRYEIRNNHTGKAAGIAEANIEGVEGRDDSLSLED
ncbi:hypothetical protein BJ508DRAFT_335800 [Ascobolus immersus RN42]|uniref:Hypervirulence associated protein TUDOR domain-containing protein n=1 Tax=Ascobolus immersus RN42 TaxID=1160509 RepID=A0A3N4HB22_ASCIM|nr:hypothetical protein BJ508DRAFT_335800 [Ascobolus immersus RN42]